MTLRCRQNFLNKCYLVIYHCIRAINTTNTILFTRSKRASRLAYKLALKLGLLHYWVKAMNLTCLWIHTHQLSPHTSLVENHKYIILFFLRFTSLVWSLINWYFLVLTDCTRGTRGPYNQSTNVLIPFSRRGTIPTDEADVCMASYCY